MATPVRIEEERCVGCGICFSACPFDAISKNGTINIDLEKCQLCGICSASCPSSLIDLGYYHYDLLLGKIKKDLESGKKDLVLMCRGASPSYWKDSEVANILGSEGLEQFSSLRLPCVGRLGTEFYLQALGLGVNNIYAIQCGESFCRYEKGSELNKIRVLELNEILKQLGYRDAVRVIENPNKVVYEPDPQKCVGCDKCVYICPYDAIEALSFGTPQLDYQKCVGCGLCTVICPHQSLYMRNFEPDRISSAINDYREEVSQLRERGVYPIALVFCCQWADFTDLDNASNGFLRENVVLMEIPCFSSLDPAHVLQALEIGFDDVMAIVCPDEDCKSKESRKTVESNLQVLENALKESNLGGRFKIHKNHPRHPEGFELNLDLFFEEVEEHER